MNKTTLRNLILLMMPFLPFLLLAIYLMTHQDEIEAEQKAEEEARMKWENRPFHKYVHKSDALQIAKRDIQSKYHEKIYYACGNREDFISDRKTGYEDKENHTDIMIESVSASDDEYFHQSKKYVHVKYQCDVDVTYMYSAVTHVTESYILPMYEAKYRKIYDSKGKFIELKELSIVKLKPKLIND